MKKACCLAGRGTPSSSKGPEGADGKWQAGDEETCHKAGKSAKK